MKILNDSLELTLPYTNSQSCYMRLESFPPIKHAFYEAIVPTALSSGDLAQRLTEMENLRQQTLDSYLEAGNSLREVDTTLNCCMNDLYIALFDTLGFRVSESDILQADKIDLIEDLRLLLPRILSWNPTKRMEINILLQGTQAELELDE